MFATRCLWPYRACNEVMQEVWVKNRKKRKQHHAFNCERNVYFRRFPFLCRNICAQNVSGNGTNAHSTLPAGRLAKELDIMFVLFTSMMVTWEWSQLVRAGLRTNVGYYVSSWHVSRVMENPCGTIAFVFVLELFYISNKSYIHMLDDVIYKKMWNKIKERSLFFII